MVKVPRGGFTSQQLAYARRSFSANSNDYKKTIALDCGYSPLIARNATTKIEKTKGFHNAIAALAKDSHNVALQVMEELKGRGFHDYSNKDLVGALNAISLAWSRFNDPLIKKEAAKYRGLEPEKNRLRAVVFQQVENQTIVPGEIVKGEPTKEDLNF
jgi:hypothetical protein